VNKKMVIEMMVIKKIDILDVDDGIYPVKAQ
jgi:hypothetical protein